MCLIFGICAVLYRIIRPDIYGSPEKMKDEDKPKEQLIKELKEMRKRVSSLEAAVNVAGGSAHESGAADAQKLGQMAAAGEMAHEFNNILTAIIGNLVLLKMYFKPGTEVFDILAETERASARAEVVTRKLLSFSIGGPLAKKRISPEKLMRDLAGSFSGDPGIVWHISACDGLWSVEAEEGRIRDAALSLLKYVKQSMPGGGTANIRIENAGRPETASLPLAEGDFIKITIEGRSREPHVEDSGDLKHPFSSAKDNAIRDGRLDAYSIIRTHHGYTGISAGDGSGVVFNVYLPAVRKEHRDKAEERGFWVPGGRRILVMDDEEIVRSVIDRMLVQCGCSAVFAGEGSEMLRLYREAMEAGKPFDAVIIDLVVAEGMGGREAIVRLLQMDPKARAIVSSGCLEDEVLTEFRKFGFAGVLAKPYQMAELSRVLNKVVKGVFDLPSSSVDRSG